MFYVALHKLYNILEKKKKEHELDPKSGGHEALILQAYSWTHVPEPRGDP